MKKLLSLLALCGILSLNLAMPAAAQGEAPYIIRSTRPMSGDDRATLDAWLAVSPPSDAFYYIVTYWQPMGAEVLVSMAGVNLDTPESEWTLEDPSVWLGSVIIKTDRSVELYNPAPVASKTGGLMRGRLAAGGGPGVMFPFQLSAMYGPRGVHGAGDYGTEGMLFVDFVGGDDMGASSMPPKVIASATGTIDYVCDDGTTVAVRTHNNTTGDYFLYAHLIDNANLNVGHTFQIGENVGGLKYGSFDETCGWAEQHSNHYHVHWGFVPAAGKFQVGSCVLTVSTQVWQCGSKNVRTGQFLVGGGGYSGSGETGGTSGAGAQVVSDPTFWDYILGGLISFLDVVFVKVLPEHGSSQIIYVFYNTIEMMFRLVRVLAYGSISVYPLVYALSIVLVINLTFYTVRIALYILRALKELAPFL